MSFNCSHIYLPQNIIIFSATVPHDSIRLFEKDLTWAVQGCSIICYLSHLLGKCRIYWNCFKFETAMQPRFISWSNGLHVDRKKYSNYTNWVCPTFAKINRTDFIHYFTLNVPCLFMNELQTIVVYIYILDIFMHTILVPFSLSLLFFSLHIYIIYIYICVFVRFMFTKLKLKFSICEQSVQLSFKLSLQSWKTKEQNNT